MGGKLDREAAHLPFGVTRRPVPHLAELLIGCQPGQSSVPYAKIRIVERRERIIPGALDRAGEWKICDFWRFVHRCSVEVPIGIR